MIELGEDQSLDSILDSLSATVLRIPGMCDGDPPVASVDRVSD